MSQLYVFIASSAYVIPSLVVYGIVITAVVKDRTSFNSSFLKLFLASSIANIATSVNAYIALRLSSLASGTDFLSIIFENIPVFLSTIMYLGIMDFAFVQFYMIFFMALNRFTCIAFPAKHELIWDILFPISMCVAVFEPFIHTYPLIYNQCTFVYNKDTQSLWPHTTYTKTTDIYLQMFSFMGILAILTISVNIISVIGLCIRSQSSKKTATVEMRLFLVSLINGSILVIVTIFTCIVYGQFSLASLVSSSTSAFLLKILPFVSDLLTLVDPYLLLIFNRNVRKRAYSLLRKTVTSTPRHSTGVSVLSIRPAGQV